MKLLVAGALIVSSVAMSSSAAPQAVRAVARPPAAVPGAPPDGVDPAKVRSPGVLVVASAKLSADEKRLEGVRQLLNAEGTGGRLIQAPDGTLLITSTPPDGVGVNSVDWPQPQQLDSNMGKVLRINRDGTIPKDNPFAGRAG